VSKAVSPARQVEDAKAKQAAVRSSIQRDCRLEFTGYIIAENGDACRRLPRLQVGLYLTWERR